jgi:signal transduction histidine kinase/DNA-binding NarL/FixJ family response regulator
MSKILILSDKSSLTEDIAGLLKEIGYNAKIAYNEADAFEITLEFQPDIALVNTSCENLNISTICKRLKLQGQTNDIQIILITSEDTSSEEVMVGADGYITRPFNDNILIATINAHLRIKKLLDILYTNNSELAKSLYQLNVLYNTSSQLAGTLNKKKLIGIMSEGLEKSISYSLCLTLIINNPEDALLIINSNYPISPRLEHALKLRGMIGYKSMFDSKTLPFELNINNIKVETYHRQEGSTYDLEVMNFDSLFAPIATSDKFFGTVEIMRDTYLSGEDSTCFQTVVNQVALPLESALLYEEIKEKNIMLEKLEKLKSEFISIVSHELRTPLTSIKNSLDIILSGKAGEITKNMDNFLNMAKRNVTRLSGIINDLLDLSKIEAGKMEYRFEPLNVAEPINFVVSTFLNLAEQKNIKLEAEVEENLPVVYGDIQRLEQILSNLVSNAVKFTEDNGNINVSAKLIDAKNLNETAFYTDSKILKPVELEKEYVKISIKDTGIGIKQNDIPKVFDKFQQIENSLSRKVGGTGLGLSIAKQLIDAHKGYIWLESEEGRGSAFSFVLPVLNSNVDFAIELENLIQKSKYSHSNFAILFIKDLHQDEKSIIKDIVRDKTIIFRKSDEAKVFFNDGELKIIVENTGRKGLDSLLEKLKTLIKESKTDQCDGRILIGTSIFPDNGTEFDELVKTAKNQKVEI